MKIQLVDALYYEEVIIDGAFPGGTIVPELLFDLREKTTFKFRQGEGRREPFKDVSEVESSAEFGEQMVACVGSKRGEMFKVCSMGQYLGKQQFNSVLESGVVRGRRQYSKPYF